MAERIVSIVDRACQLAQSLTKRCIVNEAKSVDKLTGSFLFWHLQKRRRPVNLSTIDM